MALICITLFSLGLPGVNLIIYKDDLRMMAPNAGAAREGGMKDYAEGCGIFVKRWKGEMVVTPKNKSTRLYSMSSRPASRDSVFWKWPSSPETTPTKLHTVSSRASARLTRDPVF